MNGLRAVNLDTELDLTWLRQYVNEVIAPENARDPEGQKINFAIYEELYKQGIMQVVTPKEFGGKEASVIDLCWIVRELGYGSASAAATFIGNMLGYSAPILYASPSLKEKICRDYMSKYSLWSFAMTEGETGSDLINTRTVAREVKGGFEITGEKNFITNATYSSHITVFARLIDKNGKDLGVSCFYIRGDNPGVERGPIMDKIGWKKANTGTIYFNKAFIPSENLLGEPGGGLRILTHCLNRSKTLLGALGVGIAMKALHLTQERLLDTERYGKPLLDQGAIRHLLARLHTKTEAAWLLTCRAAATWDEGLPAVKEASMAKLFSGATASEVTTQTMELFGARGFFNEYEIAR